MEKEEMKLLSEFFDSVFFYKIPAVVPNRELLEDETLNNIKLLLIEKIAI
jgi:hypothetical protein